MIKTLCIVLALAAFSKSGFYDAIQGKEVKPMRAQVELLNKQKLGSEQQAYLGAMEMKLSSFEKTPKDKLTLFKQGKGRLEKSIADEPNDTEFRFLRLIIQENAPSFLKYNQNLAEDAKFIKSTIGSTSSEIKREIQSYSKQSKFLKL